jgi:hypothetical protein
LECHPLVFAMCSLQRSRMRGLFFANRGAHCHYDYYKWEMSSDQLGRIAGGLEWIVGEVEIILKKAKGEKVGEGNERAWVKVGKKLGYGFDR